MIKCPTCLQFNTLLLSCSVLLFTLVAPAHADDEGMGTGRDVIKWPSPDFPTLQEAVNAADDEATINLGEGTFRIDSTVQIRGKRLNFVGAGNGTKRGRVTNLIGPAPRQVTDAAGNIILAADEAIGLFQVESGSDVEFSKMRISGFDAGIIIRHDEESARAPNVHVNKVLISGTGRGILSFSANQVIVADTFIENTLWNGISIGKAPAVQFLFLDTVAIGSPFGAGIYSENGNVAIANVTVSNAARGGIVCNNCTVGIVDSIMISNGLAGILLADSGGFIAQNFIHDTDAVGGVLGDGVVLWSSSAYIEDISVHDSERAGISVFGGTATLKDSSFKCSSFDIATEPLNGQPSVLFDLGGVECGCGSPAVCAPISQALEPPSPVGGLE